jgi:hypothetical protein
MPATSPPHSVDPLTFGAGPEASTRDLSQDAHLPWVALFTAIVSIVTAGTAIYIEMGAMLAIPLVGTALVAIVVWLGTSFRHSGETDRAVVFYIAGIVALMIEHADQWHSRAPELVMKLASGWAAPNFVFSERIFVVAFAIASPALFLLGGFYLVRRRPIGCYMAWLLFIWSIVAGLLQGALAVNRPHAIGIATGIAAGVLPLIIGALGIRRLTLLSGIPRRNVMP